MYEYTILYIQYNTFTLYVQYLYTVQTEQYSTITAYDVILKFSLNFAILAK